MGLRTILYQGEELVVAGRIKRAFGIKGELSVEWNNGQCPVGIGRDPVYIGSEGSLKIFRIVRDHRHGNGSLIGCDGIDSRDEAEKLRGMDIWVAASRLKKLPEGEYYSYQLLDMRVMSTDGEYLGEVREIFSTGSNDIYVVRKNGDELLVPAIEDVVRRIDLANRLMVIEVIEGLR